MFDLSSESPELRLWATTKAEDLNLKCLTLSQAGFQTNIRTQGRHKVPAGQEIEYRRLIFPQGGQYKL